jgi:hypothetical protein
VLHEKHEAALQAFWATQKTKLLLNFDHGHGNGVAANED